MKMNKFVKILMVSFILGTVFRTSIEEIEEQMDDWLENRNRTQKKQVNLKYIYIYLSMSGLSCGLWDL